MIEDQMITRYKEYTRRLNEFTEWSQENRPLSLWERMQKVAQALKKSFESLENRIAATYKMLDNKRVTRSEIFPFVQPENPIGHHRLFFLEQLGMKIMKGPTDTEKIVKAIHEPEYLREIESILCDKEKEFAREMDGKVFGLSYPTLCVLLHGHYEKKRSGGAIENLKKAIELMGYKI